MPSQSDTAPGNEEPRAGRCRTRASARRQSWGDCVSARVSGASGARWETSGMERAIILYDADCGICSWSVNRLQAWDHRRRHGGPRLRAVGIQSTEGATLLADLTPTERLRSWHFMQQGRRWSAGAAAGPCLRMLPFGALPAFFLDLYPPLTERAYRYITNHRQQIGKRFGVEACRVPTEEVST